VKPEQPDADEEHEEDPYEGSLHDPASLLELS